MALQLGGSYEGRPCSGGVPTIGGLVVGASTRDALAVGVAYDGPCSGGRHSRRGRSNGDYIRISSVFLE